MRYSVIIPHYRDFDSLYRLLSTIPDRNDVQVIVVDDNSCDSRESFLEEFGREWDPDTELYFNPSKRHGAGRCRNVGLKHAKGKWLLFADADDYFTEDAFLILDKYYDSKADIIYFTPTSVNLPDMTPGVRHKAYAQLISAYIADPGEECMLRYRQYEPWSKLIRNQTVRDKGIKFDGCRWANDVMFSIRMANAAKDIEAKTETIYCVTRKAGTLTSGTSAHEYRVRFEVYLRQYKFLKGRLDPMKFRKVIEWPGGKIVRAVAGGYGYPMVRYICERYREQGIKVRIGDLGSDYIRNSLMQLRISINDRHY